MTTSREARSVTIVNLMKKPAISRGFRDGQRSYVVGAG